MTDETSPKTDADGSPTQRTRRALVQLLGSAVAMGAFSGSVTGSGTHDTYCTDTGHEGKRNDRFEVTGLSLSDDEFRLDRLRFAPTLDGEMEELFAIEGFVATVTNGKVIRMDVGSVEIHHDFLDAIAGVLDSLAEGDVPDEFDTPPAAVHAYLDRIDTREFERLRATLENEGGADALERRLRSGVRTETDSDGYAGGFVLILVLFILLVIIGAGFGSGIDHASGMNR
ncbi:YjcZ family sporulation protein [Haladaptatus sp. AB643]|uniref:YjcZ family sporulation protein n=1 Tax=Haladaptatus sp. AB643 TaxID=2934174 RepID=UPI00209BF0CC|nr:YjcZ family sporulation protein [Haladaptatus sp. AB643]MCO8243607.1 YjcZ family sporulation protein [Haladaptatus sp. AB643]